MNTKDYIKSLKITGIALSVISMFVFLYSIQTSFGYSGTGTTQDLKSGSRVNGDILAQPFNGSVTIYFGTESTSPLGTGTAGYIGTNTAGLPKLRYSYTNGSSTVTFDGFDHVAINGSDIPLTGLLSTKLDAIGGVGTGNTFNNATIAGVGTYTATFRVSGIDISPAEWASVDGAIGDPLQIQINKKQASIGQTPLGSSEGSVTAALGSQSVNALNDVNVAFNEGDFLKISGGQVVAGSSSTGVAFSAVTGSASINSNFSKTPGFSKVPVTGSTSSSLVAWISGSLTVQSVVATATATFGTTTPINNSIVTIYGTNAPVLNISRGEGIQGIISADMTSDTAPSPNVTSASTTFSGTYPAWKAFDRDITTTWLSQNAITTGWLKYDFGVGVSRILENYQITVNSGELPGNAPKNFTLQGSNNDVDWTILDTQTGILGWVDTVYKVFYIKPYSTSYRYYKIDITAINGGSYVGVGDVKFINLGLTTVMSISEQGIVSLGTTTVKTTDTAFLFQVEGSGIAYQWGVACFEAIKSIIGSGSDIIQQGFDAVMQTPIFTHHPKKQISKEEAKEKAINDYVFNFAQIDFETFKIDNLAKYTIVDGIGSSTVDMPSLMKDFQLTFMNPRRDEFYLLNDMEQRIETKRKELSIDKTVINITPISDNPKTSPLFRLNNSDFLSLENQIGALMATAQYQQGEIGSLTAALENQKVLYNEEVDNLYAWIKIIVAALIATGGLGGWGTLRTKRKGT